jgi:urease accessory protein UreE
MARRSGERGKPVDELTLEQLERERDRCRMRIRIDPNGIVAKQLRKRLHVIDNRLAKLHNQADPGE